MARWYLYYLDRLTNRWLLRCAGTLKDVRAEEYQENMKGITTKILSHKIDKP